MTTPDSPRASEPTKDLRDAALPSLIQNFHARCVGRIIRGRKVAGVELLIDIYNDGGGPRYFINLVFTEIQYDTRLSKEEVLLNRVFDQSPRAATRLFKYEECARLLSGEDDIDLYEWTLEDEAPPKV